MKVSCSLDPETLFLLQRLIMDNSQGSARTSGKSMMVELFEIFAKRCIAYTSNPNGKPRTVTLRYHLAERLLNLVSSSGWQFGTFENNKLEIFKNELHKKLI